MARTSYPTNRPTPRKDCHDQEIRIRPSAGYLPSPASWEQRRQSTRSRLQPWRRSRNSTTFPDTPTTSHTNLVELVTSETARRPLFRQVRRDIENDLASYEIDDHTTLQRLLGTLANLDMIEAKYDDALARFSRLRQLEEKPARRFTSGMIGEAYIAATRETHGQPGDAFRQSFRQNLENRVSALPWDTVQDQIEQMKGQLEIISRELIMGIIENQIQPAVVSTGQMSSDFAARIIEFTSILEIVEPVRDVVVDVLQETIEAHRVEKEDIWAARSVTLHEADKLSPVIRGRLGHRHRHGHLRETELRQSPRAHRRSRHRRQRFCR